MSVIAVKCDGCEKQLPAGDSHDMYDDTHLCDVCYYKDKLVQASRLLKALEDKLIEAINKRNNQQETVSKLQQKIKEAEAACASKTEQTPRNDASSQL